jgi:hypothetical protein
MSFARTRYMTRYFLIVHGRFVVDDPTGQSFDGEAAAVSEAAQVARELRRDCGDESAAWSIEVHDGKRTVAIIPFSSVD